MSINGLALLCDFISEEEELYILEQLTSTEYKITEDRNNIQRYGIFKISSNEISVTPIPEFLENLSQRLVTEGHLIKKPDCISINEYYPGQGIAPHIDSHNNGETISIISLSGHTVMNFIRKGYNKVQVYFPSRALLQMSGEVRHKWQHAIESKKFDIIDGQKLERQKRYSIVLRNSIYQA